ncbi:CDF family Co(II)/Ni(II) efflux transporter DmeF [Rhodobacter capsulatus]|uniref:CDF family Co(II)/Ni(II) efflux transporter DmeF n=1 Tax=Rhodobacter capsulatus TaxID=1061 RepID=UPI0003D2D697|nr:CDF family Co(II)/Ni(II) efflux transporter DmeF [Rhodobacter capsulatus]ETD82645.1 cation transporter [Rhodobacter capsulatus YW1]
MHDHADHPAANPRLAGMAAPHDHVFLGAHHDRNARRTRLVIGITAAMMGTEIVAGTVFGSMALLADGWHMATHAAALTITAAAYAYARRQARNPAFSFGTGKIGDLAGFASAVVLAVVAVLIAAESLWRLANPVGIDFTQAILVAGIGLVVNLGSALLLHEDHSHHHDHHDHHPHGHDSNLRAAYLHVLADALTSVLAIVALIGGRIWGWVWLDPAIGLLGAVVIGRWAFGLMKQTGGVLVDHIPQDETLPAEIRAALDPVARITDLHLWQLGPGQHGAIVALTADPPQPPATYRARLAHLHELAHVTIEVNPAR